MRLFTAGDRRLILHVFGISWVASYAYGIAHGADIDVAYEAVTLGMAWFMFRFWQGIRGSTFDT